MFTFKINSDKLSIGAKYSANMERDEQTIIQTEIYIDNQANKYAERKQNRKKKNLQYDKANM